MRSDSQIIISGRLVMPSPHARLAGTGSQRFCCPEHENGVRDHIVLPGGEGERDADQEQDDDADHHPDRDLVRPAGAIDDRRERL